MDTKDGVRGVEKGVCDLLLGVVEEDVKNGEGDGLKVAQEMFTRYWFQKGMEGGTAPSPAIFQKDGLDPFYNIAVDCFNQGSASRASVSASGDGHAGASTGAASQ